MISFYCTRCGVQLQVDEHPNGQAVQCGRCAAVVRSPEADLQQSGDMVEELAEAARELAHSPRPALRVKLDDRESAEVIAERLTRVAILVERDRSSTTACPHCGSTIASYVGRCPFCRHSLHGS